jgi:hypothetical protein
VTSADCGANAAAAPALAGELEIVLRAPYGIVLLVTHEEQRALRTLADVAARLERPVETIDLGATPAELRQTLGRLALDAAAGAIHVCFDPYPTFADAALVRAWRELSAGFEARGATAVWIAPRRAVPLELEADVRVVEVPLPDEGELAELLEKALLERDLAYPATVREAMVRAARGLTAREADRAFHRALVAWQRSGDEVLARGGDVAEIIREKRRVLRQSEVLEYFEPDEGLSAIGGMGDLKAWLQSRARAFGDDARRFGLPAPRGLLLLGVQGCGKSLTAKAVAAEWRLPLVRLDLGALFGSPSGPDEALRRALLVAGSIAPSVLWIDEIEKGFSSAGGGGGADATARVLGSLLTWLQEKDRPVFVVATANEVEQLPPELLRKGRFDEVFFVDLPDARERAAIFEIHLRRRGRAPDRFDLPVLAQATDKLSGAEIEQVVVSGLYAAFAAGRELTPEDLRVAAAETVPLYATYEERIKALREWAARRTRRASLETSVLDQFRKG